MTLKKVNLFFTVFLTIIVSWTFLYTYEVTKNYFKDEHATRIKGDILELGYSVAKSMEQEGISSSLNLLYKSLATYREYEHLLIGINGKIAISTDKKQIDTLYQDAYHIDKLKKESLQADMVFFHEFIYFDKEKAIEFDLIIDLDDEYLIASEKDVHTLIKKFIGSSVLVMVLFVVFLYYLNIRPIMKLTESINKNDYTSLNFYVE